MGFDNYCDCGKDPHEPTCGAAIWGEYKPLIGDTPLRAVLGGTPDPSGKVTFDTPKACDCGAEKCRTTHAHWCSTRRGDGGV